MKADFALTNANAPAVACICQQLEGMSLAIEVAAARVRREESLRTFRQLGDHRSVARTLIALGNAAMNQGRAARARELFEESLTLSRQRLDTTVTAYAVYGLGNVMRQTNDREAARRHHEEALALFKMLGHKWMVGASLLVLGKAAVAAGELEAGRQMLDESLRIEQELGNKYPIWFNLRYRVRLRMALGPPEHAATLIGAADAVAANYGREPEHDEGAVQSCREALGDPAFEAAYAEGRGMTLDEATAYASEGVSASNAS